MWLVWATMCPPTGWTASPKKTSGFAMTWLVTTATALKARARRISLCMCLLSFCCLSASISLPRYSLLKWAVRESMTMRRTLLSFMILSAFSRRNIWWSEVYASAKTIFLTTSSGFSPMCCDIWMMRSVLKVFSVSMYSAAAFSPPRSVGSWMLTHIWWQSWLFPLPYSP